MKALLLALCLALSAVACGAAAHRTATITVVGAGGAVAALHDRHEAAFRTAREALRTRVRAAGGTLADVERERAPLEAAFDRRSEALQALSAAVYGAAATIDAAKAGGAAAYVTAARQLLDALHRGLDVLADGAVLPPVPIPAEVRRVADQLAAIAGSAQ